MRIYPPEPMTKKEVREEIRARELLISVLNEHKSVMSTLNFLNDAQKESINYCDDIINEYQMKINALKFYCDSGNVGY